MSILLSQYKTSSTNNNLENSLFITYTVVDGNPSSSNNLGIYVIDFSVTPISEVDNDEIKKIFGE